jgi:hypothetical protein
MFIYGPITGIALIISLALLVLELWALIDAALQPTQAYVAAGKQTKVFWVVILVLAVLFRGLGLLALAGIIAAIVYLVDVRPALRTIRGGGSQDGWYR